MKRAILRLANLLMPALLVGACGTGSGSSSPGPASVDGWSDPAPAGDLGAPPAPGDSAVAPDPDQQQAASCPDLVGTWKGTIEGKANTYLQNVQMTGTVTMTVAAGSAPGEFSLTSLDVEAWSPLLPLFKVPLKTIGAHTFHCQSFNISAPIEAQGKKGSGTITGQCDAVQCTGTFQGTTDDNTMDASGKFNIKKQ